jgi:hypothetical protein
MCAMALARLSGGIMANKIRIVMPDANCSVQKCAPRVNQTSLPRSAPHPVYSAQSSDREVNVEPRGIL